MQTNLSPEFKETHEGEEAEAILRKCVHCGFCNATCPTYQLLGDELDGPRGRIYLMKKVLEGAPVTRATQQHLDRCLTCRACETTCPSGVEYGRLAEIGRKIVDEKVARPAGEKALRWLLRKGLTSPTFSLAAKLGQWTRPLLPATIKDKVPRFVKAVTRTKPTREHSRKMLLLIGCVQPTLLPNIDSATIRVLDAAGIQTLVADNAGCCGAIQLHLNANAAALEDMRRNIDAWWPYVSSGSVEAIVMNASGCGVTVKEYGRSLAHDPLYADKAKRIGEITRDLSELLPEMTPRLKHQLRNRKAIRLAFHSPCTLQHGQQLRGAAETQLSALGFDVMTAVEEAHLCCGSAGTYSILERDLAYQLRDRKLKSLSSVNPEIIVSANVGCIQHLQSGTDTPVRHWVEALDDALTPDA
jgi:glycolate oxidase iron-sulfur subunit